MRKLLTVFIVLFNLSAFAATSPLPTGQTPPIIATTPYCTSGAPTVIAGYFIPTAMTASNSTTVTLTDGVNTYIAAITSSTVGCFIKQ